MKKYVFIFLILAGKLTGQNLHFVAAATDTDKTATIDSVGYPRMHPNLKSLTDAADALAEKLQRNGWIEAVIASSDKSNDSTYTYVYSLGRKIDFVHIYIGRNPELKKLVFHSIKEDTLKIPFPQLEPLLNEALGELEQRGFSLATLRLSNISQSNQIMKAELVIEPGTQRQVNDIVINGYDKFPEGHRRQVIRTFRNQTFSQSSLKKIYDEFSRFRFVTQTRYPEILFMEDTTKVYVYLEKTKANRFDGFVGFSNDDEEGRSKLRFNGYLDLSLVNILNSGEEFALFWKSDGKEQKTFDASIELPYVFKSRFALKANLNIFRQDSTFQNTKTAIAAGYLINYATRAYLGYESTESSDIQNTNTGSLSDFESKFLTGTFSFVRYKDEEFLFPEFTRIDFRSGVGKRTSKLQEDGQFYIDVSAMQNFYLNEKNIVNLRTQNFFLNSENYLVSELIRFGGINSIRGFNENSLQANVLGSLCTEYRFILATGLYVHSIIDYGWMRDDSRPEGANKNNSLLGVGFGFGLLTRNGLFNLVYANGSTDDQAIELRNSIVHISFKAKF